MKKLLVVVDMQKDFIDGELGTPEAVSVLPKVIEKIEGFPGEVVFTMDTHGADYMETQEGRNLPVSHCIRESEGWQIAEELRKYTTDRQLFEKYTFGSMELGEAVQLWSEEEDIEDITLVGLCTDICVISNALILKAAVPEIPIIVDSACCAGVTQKSHENALEAMKMCQIKIV